jgi:hypothetical protein
VSDITKLFNSVPKEGADSALREAKKKEYDRNREIERKHNVQVLATYNTAPITTLDTKDNLA